MNYRQNRAAAVDVVRSIEDRGARDRQKWFEESRWVRASRPDQQGNYRVDGLPPGEYWAVALDYVEDGTWHDPAFIESLRSKGEPLTLAEGEARTITLKLVTP